MKYAIFAFALLLISANLLFAKSKEVGYLIKLKLTVNNVLYFEGVPKFNYYYIDSTRINNLIDINSYKYFEIENMENILDSMLTIVNTDYTTNYNCAKYKILSSQTLDSSLVSKLNKVENNVINNEVKYLDEEQFEILTYDTITIETNCRFHALIDTVNLNLFYSPSFCKIEYGFCKVNIEKCKFTFVNDFKSNIKKLKKALVLKDIEQNLSMDNQQRKKLYNYFFDLLKNSTVSMYEDGVKTKIVKEKEIIKK